MKTLIAAVAVLALPCALASTVAGVDLPAPHPPCPVVDTYWGEKVEDPYRCLENTADAAVRAYMLAQADAAAAVLARIPGRAKLLERIQQIDAEVPATVTDLSRDRSGNLFYEKRLASDNQFKLYMRRGFDGAEKILVDPELLAKATGKPHAIGSYSHSPDGRRVAYSVSAGGAEIGTLHVIDTETGRDLMPAVDRIRGGSAQWTEDGSAFFYSRLAPAWEKRPRAERFLDNTVYLKRLADPAGEIAVFGPAVHPELGLARSDGARGPATGDGRGVPRRQPLPLAVRHRQGRAAGGQAGVAQGVRPVGHGQRDGSAPRLALPAKRQGRTAFPGAAPGVARGRHGQGRGAAAGQHGRDHQHRRGARGPVRDTARGLRRRALAHGAR
jgi:hypothetical protein